MRRALFLAGLAQGKTFPNPVVGSVIIKNGEVLGEGYHHRAGEHHAEINAIHDVPTGFEISGDAEMFVTLEPCAHWGRTGPCAVAIVENKIPSVVIGTVDSHNKVNGKGIQILQGGDVKVSYSDLAEACIEINRRFFTFQEKKRPYIILKWAQSQDGFLDCEGQPAGISNGLTGQFVHTLRAREDGILVGKNTALSDNPSLTTRNIYGRNPRRIVLDAQLKVPRDSKIFNPDADVFVLNQIQDEEKDHIHHIQVEDIYSVPAILSALHRVGVQSVLVEGGRKVLQNFLESGLWDEIYRITAAGIIMAGGTPAPTFSAKPLRQWTFRNDVVQHFINT